MGVFKYRYFSSSSFDDCNQNSSNNIIRIESSPDPSDYTIINAKTINNFLLLKIHYTKATNFSGFKILVFKDTTLNNILKVNKYIIDPHFSENEKYISPIARFEPNEAGWEMAIKLCNTI